MAILDAILKKTIFRGSDFGKLLVCYKVHQTLLESVEKPFVAIFWGLRVFVPYIDLPNRLTDPENLYSKTCYEQALS